MDTNRINEGAAAAKREKREAESTAMSEKREAESTAMSEQREAESTAMSAQREAGREMKELADVARDEAGRLAEVGRREIDKATTGVLDSVADQLEALADELRGQDLESILERCRTTAQRSPELFFAGSVAAGIAMSRFAKASARQRAKDDFDERTQSAAR